MRSRILLLYHHRWDCSLSILEVKCDVTPGHKPVTECAGGGNIHLQEQGLFYPFVVRETFYGTWWGCPGTEEVECQRSSLPWLGLGRSHLQHQKRATGLIFLPNFPPQLCLKFLRWDTSSNIRMQALLIAVEVFCFALTNAQKSHCALSAEKCCKLPSLWKCINTLIPNFIQCTIKQSIAYFKHKRHPPHLNPVHVGQTSKKQGIGSWFHELQCAWR